MPFTAIPIKPKNMAAAFGGDERSNAEAFGDDERSNAVAFGGDERSNAVAFGGDERSNAVAWVVRPFGGDERSNAVAWVVRPCSPFPAIHKVGFEPPLAGEIRALVQGGLLVTFEVGMETSGRGAATTGNR